MSADDAWIETWIASVADGRATMSQRSVASIERNGGIGKVVEAAEARGVHLVRLTNDQGNPIIAASPHPFETLC